MKVWISVDMEGISGIVDREQLIPDHRLYHEGRQRMLDDLRAVTDRLLADSDVEEIWINDSHDGMVNVRQSDMPPRVYLISGGAKPFSMAEGAQWADLALFVGYHAKAGTQAAIMDHTYAGEIFDVTLNGQSVGETGLNAALLGAWGVPVGMVSGDDKVAAEAKALLPDVETAVVKWGISRRAARLLPPAEASTVLQQAVDRTLTKWREGRLKPWRLTTPITLTVTLMTPEMADRGMYCPGASRLDGRTVGFTLASMEDAFRSFYTVMASAGRPLY